MRCHIQIDAAALRHNFQVFQKLAGTTTLVPVVKSNAYGHGLREAYRALAAFAPPYLAVNYLEEAETLRGEGFSGRIMIVGPLRVEELSLAAVARCDVFLSSFELLEAWIAKPASEKARAHIKIDTGMSRQGFPPRESDLLISRLSPYREALVGICSHFANVEDVLEQSYAKAQLEDFLAVAERFRKAGFELDAHIAASSSALLMQESRLSFIRVGISMYGLWPSRSTQLSYLQSYGSMLELKPVLSWLTEVALVKPIKTGQFIGYGCTYKALRNMTIAVLPVGYYEGYPRLASNRGHVLIRGQRCPIVGRICMNMMMVDISYLGGDPVKPGEKVTLIGQDRDEHVDAAQIGEWADTIHYEIVTQLNAAIPRILR